MALPYATINQLEKAIKENVSTQEIANTVNRAIQEGKISIPQNINVEDLPYIEDLDNVTIEDVNKIRGKCFNWSGIISYPIFLYGNDKRLYYVAIADDTYLYYFNIDYTDESNIVTQDLVQYPLGNLKDIIPNPDLSGTESELTGLQIGDTVYKVFNPEDSGLFVTDNMHYGYDSELGRYNAYFQHIFNIGESEKIPDSGLAIIMFNTTCVCIPYVRNQENRFICNAICDNNGTSMVARCVLSINEVIYIGFDENYAETVDSNMMNQPYCVVRFIGI